MRNLNSISISFPLLFFFFFIYTTTTASIDLIDTTCKKCTIQSPYLNYNFCSISLHSYPLNQTNINLKSLAIVAMNLALANTTATISTIQTLMDGGYNFDEFAIGCLNDCLELYTDAVTTIQNSIEALQEGKYEDANFMISAIMEATVTCQEGFTEKEGEVSPLTKEDYIVYQLGDIALCIINLVSSKIFSSQS